MKKRKEKNKQGFEIHEISESSVIFKRVIPIKGRNPKEVYQIEMGLPKVTMVYFSDNDLSRLREIEKEISEKISTKKGKFSNIIRAIGRLIVE